jgi:hypothetical protein
MTLTTVDVEPNDPTTVRTVRARPRPTWAVVSAAVLVLLLAIGNVLASHYQPIEVTGGWAVGHPIGAQQEVTTQDFWLRNTGPLGVTVVGLHRGDYQGSTSRARTRLAPTMICPIESPRGGDCPQNRTTGLIVGMKFHPFSLTTDTNRPLVLQYNYHCAAGTGSIAGTVSFPVTYRFLWFTHTIVLNESANDTFACAKT